MVPVDFHLALKNFLCEIYRSDRNMYDGLRMREKNKTGQNNDTKKSQFIKPSSPLYRFLTHLNLTQEVI